MRVKYSNGGYGHCQQKDYGSTYDTQVNQAMKQQCCERLVFG